MAGGVWFAKAADGRGWLFEEVEGKLVLKRLWVSPQQFNVLKEAASCFRT